MAGLLNLLNNQGAASGTDITGDWFTWTGGPGDFWVWGNLGGGTISLQAAIDTTAPVTICGTETTAVTTTSSAVDVFHLNHGTQIRAVLTGTTSTSSGVYVKVN